jgi:hypothetical protein
LTYTFRMAGWLTMVAVSQQRIQNVRVVEGEGWLASNALGLCILYILRVEISSNLTHQIWKPPKHGVDELSIV